MAPLKDVQPLTGYIRGGVTVFGAKKAYPVYVDETAILFDKISVSAGTRGTQLILTPRRLPPRRPGPRSRSPNRRPDQTDPPKLGAPSSHLTGESAKRGSQPTLARKPIARGNPMTSALWTHLVKDLRIEWRSREAINSMLFFALLVVVLFSIAFDPRGAFSQRNRRRRALRGHHVRLRQRPQPGLGPRNPPPGPGRAAHGSHPRRGTLSRQDHRQLPLRLHRADCSRARLPRLLQPAHRRQRLAAGPRPARSAPGPWSPTEPSSPRSPSAAATANCCSR